MKQNPSWTGRCWHWQVTINLKAIPQINRFRVGSGSFEQPWFGFSGWTGLDSWSRALCGLDKETTNRPGPPFGKQNRDRKGAD